MKNIFVKKISILGLVLIAASAVTAAILPAKAEKEDGKGGSLTMTDDSSVSCEITHADITNPCLEDECSESEGSGSTSEAMPSDDVTTLSWKLM